MAAPVRNKREREFDLSRIARWYRAGMTAGEMAAKIGVSRQQVCYDLRQLGPSDTHGDPQVVPSFRTSPEPDDGIMIWVEEAE
jgi:hypothetical protein